MLPIGERNYSLDKANSLVFVIEVVFFYTPDPILSEINIKYLITKYGKQTKPKTCKNSVKFKKLKKITNTKETIL